MTQKTPAQLAVATTVNDSDLFVGYPVGGPMYGITAANLRVALESTSLLIDGTRSMTGTLKGVAGTEGAPGYTFDGDTDTGIFRFAANVGALSAGGLGYLKWSSAGIETLNGVGYIGASLTTGAAGVSINGASGTNRVVNFQTAGALRWVIYADNIAESGSSAGSDFRILRQNDIGNQFFAITISRASGLVTVGTDLLVSGALGVVGAITATGGVVGNVTGNVTGSSGSTTGNAATATKWATARAMTGDVTASAFDGTAAIPATLATVNANVGTFGDAVNIPVVTVNAKGLITAVTTAAPSTTVNFAPVNKSANYTLVITDVGKAFALSTSPATLTIPANASVALPVGTVDRIYNFSGSNWTIAITSDSLIWFNGGAGGSGSRTLATNGYAEIWKQGNTVWYITGVGLT